jgi:hypothetical protein
MVDEEARIRMAIDERRARVEVSPEEHVDRKAVPRRFARDAIDARIVRPQARFPRGHHDANGDGSRLLPPFGDDLADRRIRGVDGLDDCEAPRVLALHLERIARVVLVERKGRDENRPVDADPVHRGDHLVAGDVGRPVRHAVPGALGRVRFVSVDLRVDDRHGP